MAPTIFYSWQSDSDPETNHTFIKKCLKAAIKALIRDGHVEEAPRLDHDMKGVHGDQDVVPTILSKIDECDIFVADITIVAKTAEGKNIPNPNVLLELGYAYKAASAGRIIKVMNTAYGTPEEGLPFDLAHKRWPYTYELPPGASEPERARIKQKVAQDLKEIISMILKAEGVRSEVTPEFNGALPAWKSSSFIDNGFLGQYQHPGMDAPMQVEWVNGVQCFLRSVPLDGLTGMTTRKLLDFFSGNALRPFGKNAAPYNMANERGVVTFELRPEGKPTQRFSQLFETGEIWGIESLPGPAQQGRYLPFPYLVDIFTTSLGNYLAFMQNQLKASPPVKIIAGVSGVTGYVIADKRFILDNRGGLCPKDEVIYEQIVTKFDVDIEEALSPFFQKLWEEFGLPGTWR